MKKYKPYLISLAITAVIAGIGAAVTYSGMESFRSLDKPPFSPPEILFPLVWTVLYILMSLAGAKVFLKSGAVFTLPVKLYAAQLIFNLGWSILFFGFGAYLLSFWWIVALWLLVLLMIVTFYPVDHTASVSQIPYLIWISFAAYLNLGIWYLNR